MVTQEEIANLQQYKVELSDKKRKLETVEVKIKVMENEIMERLRQGEGIEEGKLTALIQKVKRVTISWKQVVIDNLGAVFADDVLKKTTPKVTAKLVVSEKV